MSAIQSDRLTDAQARKYARLAGLLYLAIFICAGFAQGFVREGFIVAGDAAATTTGILENKGLFRLGLVADLIAFLCDAVVAVLLYTLLRPVSKTLSLCAAALRLLAHPAIAGVNLLNHFAAMYFAADGHSLGAFDAAQLETLVLFFCDAHKAGYLIAGAFFGLHCLVLGYLLFRSDYFPALIGVLMSVAALGYLAESFGNFLVPGAADTLAWLVAIPAVIGELALCLWLLVKGVRPTAPGA